MMFYRLCDIKIRRLFYQKKPKGTLIYINVGCLVNEKKVLPQQALRGDIE